MRRLLAQLVSLQDSLGQINDLANAGELLMSCADDDPRLRELLTRPLDDDADHAEALKRLREHPALDAARSEARAWADRARETLVALPDGGARNALTALCDYVVTRTG